MTMHHHVALANAKGGVPIRWLCPACGFACGFSDYCFFRHRFFRHRFFRHGLFGDCLFGGYFFVAAFFAAVFLIAAFFEVAFLGDAFWFAGLASMAWFCGESGFVASFGGAVVSNS